MRERIVRCRSIRGEFALVDLRARGSDNLRMIRLLWLAPLLLVSACKGGGDSGGDGGSTSSSGSSNSAGSSGVIIEAGGNVCDLPIADGNCDGSIRRFVFNKATGKCQSDTYGGCAANANSFTSAADCVAACGSSADNPCDVVTCDAQEKCVYVGPTPTCARPCGGDASVCASGTRCQCAGGCVNCKDCIESCLP